MKKLIKKIFDNPKAVIEDIKKLVKKYFHENRVLFMFVLANLFNAILLRTLTIGNFYEIKPFLADLSFVLFIGSFSYLISPKRQIIYYGIWTFILTFICIVNSIYYTFYTSFASISLLATSRYVAAVGDAIVQNVFKISDLLYLIFPVLLFIVHFYLKKHNYYSYFQISKVHFIRTFIISVILGSIFFLTLSSLEWGRFIKQWNREYVVSKFGIYTYHINDGIQSVRPKISSLFGYDNAMKTFKEYFSIIKEKENNDYTDILKGKNVIVIHAESMQQFAMNLSFNGESVTPNLNKLADSGLFFENFYAQVSVGTSSDSELTFNTSLMPSSSGTAFVNYFDREYISLPALLREKGYYTFSMHANTGDFWNRNVMHKNLGFQKFYSKSSFEVNEENKIGLGLSDKAFFEQAIPKIKEIADKNEHFYGTFIMLTNHTPFDEVDKYGEFDVDIKESIDGTIISHPYMENTKMGNYFKALHYADQALGQFINDLDMAGLLENTVVVIYGDHDARLPRSDYVRLYNYDSENDVVLDKEDPSYYNFDYYQYELSRKVPFIIWTKDGSLTRTVSSPMGMIDVLPTLGNMLGVDNEYALGNDIFNINDDNIIVFPNGNWLTNKLYYNAQKEEYLSLLNEAISEEYTKSCIDYSNKLLTVSNDIIVYDLIKKSNQQTVNEVEK